MPDVALASSSLSALHLGGSSLDDRHLGSLEGLEDLEGTQMSLDLGDGSHHQVGSILYGLMEENSNSCLYNSEMYKFTL